MLLCLIVVVILRYAAKPLTKNLHCLFRCAVIWWRRRCHNHDISDWCLQVCVFFYTRLLIAAHAYSTGSLSSIPRNLRNVTFDNNKFCRKEPDRHIYSFIAWKPAKSVTLRSRHFYILTFPSFNNTWPYSHVKSVLLFRIIEFSFLFEFNKKNSYVSGL